VTHSKTRPKECHKTDKLDIKARLEKRTFHVPCSRDAEALALEVAVDQGLTIEFPILYREDLAELFRYLAAGDIAPAVSDRFPLKEAARAHERVATKSSREKAVLV
jgi:NADPH:quinone reductase-like Zn-dependent oxidoreductase